VVPRLSLLDDGEPAVFWVREGKVARVPVKLGYAEGPWVEIRDGLAAGDQVVTAGSPSSSNERRGTTSASARWS
jgi:membrane fusion protein, multidrug efflux system